ncbi:MAG TPA: LysM peptidoglycan-binding domain-containing protein [Campylobacterales bacterium]|nr:LysM peptidoglycan-binding domain-containing protein [Campylobacterales bacterium]HHC11459.1 LysM peptidoglycan-binding domain-containing protein [Campylobacterales bacterium]
MESLSGSEVDSLSTVSDNVDDAITEKDSSKKASSNEKPNTYNKVVLDDKTEKSSDELSKLSDEISSAIDTEESASKDNTDYTQAITKEVKTRTKEMRYVTVKRGDTLGKIAKKVYGNVMYYKKIYEANPDILRRPDRIYIGQRLRVPE